MKKIVVSLFVISVVFAVSYGYVMNDTVYPSGGETLKQASSTSPVDNRNHAKTSGKISTPSEPAHINKATESHARHSGQKENKEAPPVISELPEIPAIPHFKETSPRKNDLIAFVHHKSADPYQNEVIVAAMIPDSITQTIDSSGSAQQTVQNITVADSTVQHKDSVVQGSNVNQSPTPPKHNTIVLFDSTDHNPPPSSPKKVTKPKEPQKPATKTVKNPSKPAVDSVALIRDSLNRAQLRDSSNRVQVQDSLNRVQLRDSLNRMQEEMVRMRDSMERERNTMKHTMDSIEMSKRAAPKQETPTVVVPKPVEPVVSAADTAKPVMSAHSLSLTFSNNGELDNILKLAPVYNDIQLQKYSTGYVFSSKRSDVKFNLHYEFSKQNKSFVSVKLGFYKRSESFDADDSLKTGKYVKNGTIDQSAISVSVAYLCHVVSVYKPGNDLKKQGYAKLVISTGLELPLHFTGRLQEEYDEFDGNDYYHETNKADGGFATGITSLTTANYYLSKGFFVRGDASFGLMYASLGGTTSQTIDYYPNSPSKFLPKFSSESVKYTRLYFSNPEVFLGFGFSF